MTVVFLPATTVEIVVPSTRNFDQPITVEEHEAIVRQIGNRFDRWFGGATATRELGFYKGVFEPVTRVWSYAYATATQERAVKRVAKWLQITLSQDSVLVTINGRPQLIF